MKCTSPRMVGFQADGKTLAWSQKIASKEYASFQLPCGKCLACRLEYARTWAVRCLHESMIHERNCFVTFTYDEENVPEKLDYSHFQLFMKTLRYQAWDKATKVLWKGHTRDERSRKWKELDKETRKELATVFEIGVFVTGEYGDRTKRPHWHALLFNYQPSDGTHKYTSERGDKVYESKELTSLWGKGAVEYGSITFESAGYCARYAAKKLAHGHDDKHSFQPISRKSSKHAIGKRFLEKYWPDVFNYGQIVLPNGTITSIPRYYEKWLAKHRPDDWEAYLDRVKLKRAADAAEKERIEKHNAYVNDYLRFEKGCSKKAWSKRQVKKRILELKFKELQKHNKF